MMNWIVSSSVLILVIILLRFVLKGKISLRLQYGLWALVLVRLLVPVSVGETVMSVGNWLDQAFDTKEVQQVVEYTKTPLPSMSYETAYDIVEKEYAQQGIDIEKIPAEEFSETIEYEILDTMNNGHTPEEIAEVVWIAGMVVLGVWFLYSNIRFSVGLRKNRALLGISSEILDGDGAKPSKVNSLRVYQTDEVETPCLYGLFSPAIYVTSEVVGQDVCMRHVLEHESTHYRHMDHIWSLLRGLCLVLHWYNPLVWCAVILSRNDAELACDEATIQRLGETERAAYGRTLIGLTCEKRPAVLITATTMTGSSKSIKERITLIAKKPQMAMITLVVVVLLASIAVGATYTGAKFSYASFSEWADTIEPEELLYVHVYKGYATDQLRYNLSEDEVESLIELIQSIPEEKCYRRVYKGESNEPYSLYFMWEENHVLLKCLDDKTVLVGRDSEMPAFAPEGMSLYIDSPELWNYIVDTVDEKGQPEKESEKIEQVIYQTTADLNHDNIKDSVRLMTYGKEHSIWQDIGINGAYIKVFLGTGDDSYETEPVYTSDFVASAHATNGTYVLTKKDGKDYLIHSLMYEMQGIADYNYSVMCIIENEMVTIKTDKETFYCDPFRRSFWTDGPRREQVIPEFKEGMEPWIKNGRILVSFDVNTPDFIASYSYEQIPASSYYDMVWARSEAGEIAEFEKDVGTEEWQQTLYWSSTNYSNTKEWIEEQVDSDYSKWYTDYDGSKLQRVDNCEYGANIVGCSVPASCDVIYYRADAREDEQDAIKKMIEKMIQARMVESDHRPYVITDYAIPEQKLYQISENMWLIPFLNGYYAYEGTDLVTMQEVIASGEPVTENGLIQFVAQGSEDVFYHILIEKDGVYRLQRLGDMMN